MLRRSTERRAATQNVISSSNRGKKVWSEEEDESLRKLVEIHGTGNWTLIAQSLPERSGKQCRERFHNHLDKGIKKGDWTEEEDRIIIILQKAMGNQWAKITKMLPGRTDNAVKNRFHATERAKSRGKLDDAFLNDPEYAEKIIKEAMRVNKDDAPYSSDVETESHASSYTYSSRSSYATTTATPVSFAQVTGPVSHLGRHPAGVPLQATAVPMAVPSMSVDFENDFMDDGEEDEDDGEDQDDGQEYSVDELMELDIISLDEDDFDFDEFASPSAPAPAARPNDGCFSFDWGSGRFNPVDISKAKDLANRASYLCGLDNCLGGNNNNHQNKPPVATTAMTSDMYYLQQKMSLNAQYHQQQHHPMNPGMMAHAPGQYPPTYPNNGMPMQMNYNHYNQSNMNYNPAGAAPVYGHPYPAYPHTNAGPSVSSATSFFCSR